MKQNFYLAFSNIIKMILKTKTAVLQLKIALHNKI